MKRPSRWVEAKPAVNALKGKTQKEARRVLNGASPRLHLMTALDDDGGNVIGRAVGDIKTHERTVFDDLRDTIGDLN